jgi:hypothetical protein
LKQQVAARGEHAAIIAAVGFRCRALPDDFSFGWIPGFQYFADQLAAVAFALQAGRRRQ